MGRLVFDAVYGVGRNGNAPHRYREGYVNFGWFGVVGISACISLWLAILTFSCMPNFKTPSLLRNLDIPCFFSQWILKEHHSFSVLDPKKVVLIVILIILLWVYNACKGAQSEMGQSTEETYLSISRSAFYNLDTWIDNNGWAGYDPYDIRGQDWFLLFRGSLRYSKKTRSVLSLIERAFDPLLLGNS